MEIVTVDCRDTKLVSLAMYYKVLDKYDTLRKSVLPIMKGIPKGAFCNPWAQSMCVYIGTGDFCGLLRINRVEKPKQRKLKACRNLCKLMGWE